LKKRRLKEVYTSTRSIIASKFTDGSIKAIYVHHDGMDHFGTLKNFYNSQDKVEALISLGDLSSLGNSLEDCNAYCRDHGKELIITDLASLDDVSELYWCQEYVYTWDGSEWSMKEV